jgi:acyl-CoA synthetase (AMP-forming)/AMP-acid ligase II
MLPRQAIVRWDEAKQDFVRGANGRLQRCGAGEAGVMLGKIADGSGFDGYQDRAATEGKIVRGAFDASDAWFNTGDLMRVDRWRNLYFADRLGDTFRWKGENVSTFEVEEQIAAWPAAREVNVYGVSVAGTEGRAGMAALVLAPGVAFDPASFKAHVDRTLPKYARPVFVRLEGALETTTTLKLKKGDLQREGIDPGATGAPLFVRHPLTGDYVRLDDAIYRDIASGRLAL